MKLKNNNKKRVAFFKVTLVPKDVVCTNKPGNKV